MRIGGRAATEEVDQQGHRIGEIDGAVVIEFTSDPGSTLTFVGSSIAIGVLTGATGDILIVCDAITVTVVAEQFTHHQIIDGSLNDRSCGHILSPKAQAHRGGQRHKILHLELMLKPTARSEVAGRADHFHRGPCSASVGTDIDAESIGSRAGSTVVGEPAPVTDDRTARCRKIVIG